MAEMLITKGIESIKIVGLDKTCVFYTGARWEDETLTSLGIQIPQNIFFVEPLGEHSFLKEVIDGGYIQIDHVSGNYNVNQFPTCLLYTSPSPRDATLSRMPSSA